MTKVRAWISAARLRTLPLSISGILMAGGVALLANQFTWTIFWLAIATTLGFQILSNFANDYGDGVKGTDNKDRVGPARAMQSGLLSAKELKYGIIITSVVTLLLSTLLIFSAFGNDHFLLSFLFFNLGIAAVAAAIKYTVGKSAYGYRAMGDFFVFLFFGLVGVVGCFFLFTISLSNFILLPAITIGLLSAAVLNLNNMRDRIPDKKVNKRTLAVVLGAEKSKRYHYALIGFAFFSALVFLMLTGQSYLDFICLLAFVPLFVHLRVVSLNEAPALLDPELKKVALSTFLFALLFFGSQLI